MKNNLKICFSILLSITMILCMSSCGKSNKYEFSDESDDYLMKDDSESKNSMEAKKILDLNGSWVEEGEEGGESYQAGYIENGVIEMFWMSEGGNTASLYWSGTYEAPTSPSDEYSWNSVNDKNRTQYALLASEVDTKTFRYSDGVLSYEVSALGMTKTVNLVRSERDYTIFKNSSSTTGSIGTESEGKVIELVNSNYFIIPGSYGNKILYEVQIHNPNETLAVEFPKIHITARSADGSILKTEDQVLNAIAASDTITYGNYVSNEGALADTVEITVENDNDDYNSQEGSETIKQSDLVISNTSENIGSYGTTYTGEVVNNSAVNLDSVCIIIIYKKGDLILGGETTYVDGLASGESKPFELSSFVEVEHDSYEVYALQW